MKNIAVFAEACRFALELAPLEPNPVMAVVEEYMDVLTQEELEAVVALIEPRAAVVHAQEDVEP